MAQAALLSERRERQGAHQARQPPSHHLTSLLFDASISARSALACAFANSSEFEAAVVRAQRARGAFDPWYVARLELPSAQARPLQEALQLADGLELVRALLEGVAEPAGAVA